MGGRQVVSGIAQWYKPEDLIGKKIILVANLKPAKLCGVESNGMICAADAPDGSASVVFPDQSLPCGAKIRLLPHCNFHKNTKRTADASEKNLHQRFFCLFGLCQNHPITIVPCVNMVWMGFCVGKHGFCQPLPQECLQLLYFMQLHACTQV